MDLLEKKYNETDMEYDVDRTIQSLFEEKVKIGDENATVHTFAKIEEGIPGAISFLSNPKYTQMCIRDSYATGNTRLCAKVNFVANMNMTCNAYLPAEHAPFSLSLIHISVPSKDAVLVVSYIGMATGKVKVQPKLTITLKSE